MERTLDLMHRWGYAPTIDALASELFGGRVEPDRLFDVIRTSERFIHIDRFVCLPGHEGLLRESCLRVQTNRAMNGRAKAVAQDFAERLLRLCPFVECVAISGSVASGGYVPADDIDLDIFVPDGTKYLTYAISLALSFGASLRHRQHGRLRKIICINVIWTRSQTSPFARNDASLAFELLHCRPLVGPKYFREVIRRNQWVEGYFPQVAVEPVPVSAPPGPSLLGKLVSWVVAHPAMLTVAERIGRAVSHRIYDIVHWLRRNDRAARERLDFLKRAKYPYEVFQD